MVDAIRKVNHTSTTIKVIGSTVVAIAVAWIGAWQTVNATATNPHYGAASLSDGQRAQVQLIVNHESPITVSDRTLLYQTLNSINAKLTSIQITVAGDHVLIQHIARNTKP